jgi:4-hydroxybenzoate polyprenyltransferase
MKDLTAFLESLRPRQWTKNLLLFAGVIFAQRLGETACVVRAALGALVFCFASGAVYVFNDIVDRELD